MLACRGHLVGGEPRPGPHLPGGAGQLRPAARALEVVRVEGVAAVPQPRPLRHPAPALPAHRAPRPGLRLQLRPRGRGAVPAHGPPAQLGEAQVRHRLVAPAQGAQVTQGTGDRLQGT